MLIANQRGPPCGSGHQTRIVPSTGRRLDAEEGRCRIAYGKRARLLVGERRPKSTAPGVCLPANHTFAALTIVDE